MSEIPSLIEKAWNLRWSQQIEATVELYTKIAALDQTKAAQSELELLWSSILRAQGRQSDSVNKLSELEERLARKSEAPPNRFYFERGLKRYVGCDFLGAYEDFSLFLTKAASDVERAAGLINNLLCLESLGFETKKIEAECERVLSANAKNTEIPWPQVRRHFDGFTLRKSFKNGVLPSETLDLSKNGARALDFVRYFEIWIGLLPYYAKGLKLGQEDLFQQMIVGSEHLYHKSFRLRTLTFKWHPDDFEIGSFSDLSERLYLWTQHWLADPSVVSSEKIGYTLKAIAASKNLTGATPIEAALIRNAIGWLALFNPDLLNSVRELNIACQSILSAQSMPLLDLEHSLIKLLKSGAEYGERMFGENEVLLTSHPLWNNENLLFKNLYENIRNSGASKSMSVVAERLRGTLFKKAEANKEARTLVMVNLMDYTVERSGSGKIVSEPLAKALGLMSSNESIGCAELMRESFGIRAFDPLIHHTKLYNLIARAKAALNGVVNLKTKNGIIYCEGDWSRVSVISIDPVVDILRRETKRSAKKIARELSRNGVKTKDGIRLLERGKLYSRDELAELLGGSRATVIRKINDLIECKKLKRMGGSRSIKYIVLENS